MPMLEYVLLQPFTFSLRTTNDPVGFPERRPKNIHYLQLVLCSFNVLYVSLTTTAQAYNAKTFGVANFLATLNRCPIGFTPRCFARNISVLSSNTHLHSLAGNQDY